MTTQPLRDAPNRNNKSGFLGVSFCKRTKKWVVQIKMNNLGGYKTKEEAAAVYAKAVELIQAGQDPLSLKPIRPAVSLEERFWAKVVKGPNCWLWHSIKNKDWYGQILVRGRPVNAHRVAYELTVGEIPKGKVVDHICHNRACVNPAHLRVCDPNQNGKNRVVNKNNTSGYRGVSFQKDMQQWVAKIKVNHKTISLGSFLEKADAAEAYRKAAEHYFGEFKGKLVKGES